MYKQLYNVNALLMMHAEMDYDDFNTAILDSGRATALTIKERCKGWYMFSRNALMPVIEEKNRIFYTLQHSNLPITASDSLQCHLTRVSKPIIYPHVVDVAAYVAVPS
jgi:hypothetical protein